LVDACQRLLYMVFRFPKKTLAQRVVRIGIQIVTSVQRKAGGNIKLCFFTIFFFVLCAIGVRTNTDNLCLYCVVLCLGYNLGCKLCPFVPLLCIST
jgi:hypothetical protein